MTTSSEHRDEGTLDGADNDTLQTGAGRDSLSGPDRADELDPANDGEDDHFGHTGESRERHTGTRAGTEEVQSQIPKEIARGNTDGPVENSAITNPDELPPTDDFSKERSEATAPEQPEDSLGFLDSDGGIEDQHGIGEEPKE